MGKVMLGSEVAKAMKEELIREVELLKEKGTQPCLTIVRVGERADDLAYERGAKRRMELVGIKCVVEELPADISQETFDEIFQKINEDSNVHGILLFQPLPEHLSAENAKRMIHPLKDMDCMCEENVAKVFLGDKTVGAPCTAEAVMEMLRYYHISLTGKKVVILGRSMVVGKPLSMLMLAEDATVTVCHSKSKDLDEICREADILVAAVGRPRFVTADMVKSGCVVVDVGINVDEEGNMCGDVDYDEVEKLVSYISPVPKGVGGITTSVLAKHVVQAAKFN